MKMLLTGMETKKIKEELQLQFEMPSTLERIAGRMK